MLTVNRLLCKPKDGRQGMVMKSTSCFESATCAAVVKAIVDIVKGQVSLSILWMLMLARLYRENLAATQKP